MMQSSLFERLGGQPAVDRLVERYLETLQTDPAFAGLASRYKNGFDHYRTRMREYLAGFLGGPMLYMEKRGIPQLREQHQRFHITPEMRDQWYGCMTQAITREVTNAALRRELEAAFWSLAESLCES